MHLDVIMPFLLQNLMLYLAKVYYSNYCISTRYWSLDIFILVSIWYILNINALYIICIMYEIMEKNTWLEAFIILWYAGYHAFFWQTYITIVGRNVSSLQLQYLYNNCVKIMMHLFMQELCKKTNYIIFLHYCQQIQTNFLESDIFLSFAKPILFMGFFFPWNESLKIQVSNQFLFLIWFVYRPGQPKIDSHSTMRVYFRLPRSV